MICWDGGHVTASHYLRDGSHMPWPFETRSRYANMELSYLVKVPALYDSNVVLCSDQDRFSRPCAWHAVGNLVLRPQHYAVGPAAPLPVGQGGEVSSVPKTAWPRVPLFRFSSSRSDASATHPAPHRASYSRAGSVGPRPHRP